MTFINPINADPNANTAIPHVHEVHAPPVTEQAVQEEVDEEMAANSPDGRPADEPARHRGRVALWLLLLIGLPAVLASVIWIGGAAALGMGIVYVLVLAFVSFPVWYAGMMRQEEEAEAKQHIKHVIQDDQVKHPPLNIPPV